MLAIALFFSIILGVSAERNITVDDFARDKIKYNPIGEWESLSNSITVDRLQRTTTWTYAQGGSATFNFTGTAIYFIGYGVEVTFPDDPGTFRVNLDGQTFNPSTNVEPGNPAQQLLFAQSGLAYGPHSITVKKTSTSGTKPLNVDGFIYTVPDDAVDSETTSPGSLDVNVTTSSTSSNSPAPIIGAAIGGLAIGTGIMTFIVWILRRRRAQNEIESYPQTTAAPYMVADSRSQASLGDFSSLRNARVSSVDPLSKSGLGPVRQAGPSSALSGSTYQFDPNTAASISFAAVPPALVVPPPRMVALPPPYTEPAFTEPRS